MKAKNCETITLVVGSKYIVRVPEWRTGDDGKPECVDREFVGTFTNYYVKDHGERWCRFKLSESRTIETSKPFEDILRPYEEPPSTPEPTRKAHTKTHDAYAVLCTDPLSVVGFSHSHAKARAMLQAQPEHMRKHCRMINLASNEEIPARLKDLSSAMKKRNARLVSPELLRGGSPDAQNPEGDPEDIDSLREASKFGGVITNKKDVRCANCGMWAVGSDRPDNEVCQCGCTR